MIKGKDIICISYTTWEGEYTKSTVKLLSLLALENNVVFIEYPKTIKDLFKGVFGLDKVPVLRMLGLEKRVQTITADTGAKLKHVVMPAVLPTASIKNNKILDLFYKWNTYLYGKKLLKIKKTYNLNNSIVITAFNPVYGLAMVGKLNERTNIYYCYDGMDLNRNNAKTIELEKKFCKKVDAVITTSDYLNDEKKHFNRNSLIVKNGVDCDMFLPYAKKTVNASTKKIIGYTGSLDYRFDIDLIEFAVQELSNYSFEFTGGLLNQKVVDRLLKYKNVTFNSAVKASEVPAVVKNFDVGIIPYLLSEINKNIYPLKINEYLAIGVPVVMTEFAVLKDFENVVSVTRSKEEFVAQIRYQIENDRETLIQKRIEFAKKNSWNNRALQFGEYINRLYKK